MDLIACTPPGIIIPGDILRNPSGALEGGGDGKKSKNDNFSKLFFNFEKKIIICFHFVLILTHIYIATYMVK